MQIYNDEHKRIGTLSGVKEDYSITTTLDSGDKELEFEYPVNGSMTEKLKEEYYIRTKTDEFVLKAKERSGNFIKYTAQLNVEELTGKNFPYGFASNEVTIRECLEFAFADTGWTVGNCEIKKKRTIDSDENVTAWKILQDALETYRCECKIDSINKIVNIYEEIGEDKGCYFVEGLNLRSISNSSDTYNFYTQIYPIGKDGIEIEWLNGQPYIENFQYSKKKIMYVWKDERYTNTTSLIEDATAKLMEASVPYEAYTADVVDLAKANEKYKSILSYGIGDTVWLISKKNKVKKKRRIVKIVEYPKNEKKNTCELSSATKTFAEVQQTEVEMAKQDAVSISKSKTKAILDGYYTKQETETHITASEEKIGLVVQETYSGLTTQISNKSDETLDASKGYTDKKGEETTQKITDSYKTAIEQNSQSVEIKIDSVQERVTKQGDDLDEYKRETSSFFRYSDDGLEIGKRVDNETLPYSMRLDNEKMSFMQSGSEIAYVQYNKMHINAVEAMNRLSVGAASDGGYFDFISTQYGMGVKWRDTEPEEETVPLETMSLMRAVRKQEYTPIVDDDGIFNVEFGGENE